MGTVDPLTEDGIRDALTGDHRQWLAHLDVFASIESTNDWLAAQQPPARGRLAAAVADYQSKGRGRRDRQWDIPPGHGLCLSVGRALAVPPDAISALTLACGVAVAESLESTGARSLALKWPNDLVLADGKLGGILSEVVSRGQSGLHVVVGIGINVSLPGGFSPPGNIGWGRGPAALAEGVDELPPRAALAAALIETLQQTFDTYEREGFEPFAARWRSRDWLCGSELRVGAGKEEIRGVAAGIDDDGALVLNTDGGRRRILAGDILGCRRPGAEEANA